VTVFDPSMSAATIQSRLTTVFNQQQTNQFGTQRYALLFKAGTYNVDANVASTSRWPVWADAGRGEHQRRGTRRGGLAGGNATRTSGVRRRTCP